MEDSQQFERPETPQRPLQTELNGLIRKIVEQRFPGCLLSLNPCEEAEQLGDALRLEMENSGVALDEERLTQLERQIPYPAKLFVIEIDQEGETAGTEQLARKINDTFDVTDWTALRLPTDLLVMSQKPAGEQQGTNSCGVILVQKLCRLTRVCRADNATQCTFGVLTDGITPVEVVVTAATAELQKIPASEFEWSNASSEFTVSIAHPSGDDYETEYMRLQLHVAVKSPAHDRKTTKVEGEEPQQDQELTLDVTTLSSARSQFSDQQSFLCLDIPLPQERDVGSVSMQLDVQSAMEDSILGPNEASASGNAIVDIKLVGIDEEVPPSYTNATVVLGDVADPPPYKLCVLRADHIQRLPSVQNIYDEDATQATEETDTDLVVQVVTGVFFVEDNPGLTAPEVDLSRTADAEVVSNDLIPSLYGITDHSRGMYLAMKRAKESLSRLSSRMMGYYENIYLVCYRFSEEDGKQDETEGGAMHEALDARFPPHQFSRTILPASAPELLQQSYSWLLVSQFIAPIEDELPPNDDISALGMEHDTARSHELKSREGFQSDSSAVSGKSPAIFPQQILTDAKIVLDADEFVEADGVDNAETKPILRCELTHLDEECLPLPEPWSPASRRTDSPPAAVDLVSSVAIIPGSPDAIEAKGFQIRSPNLAAYLARQEGVNVEELYFCVTRTGIARSDIYSHRGPLFTDIVCVPPGDAVAYENTDYRLLSYDGQLQHGWNVFYKNIRVGSPVSDVIPQGLLSVRPGSSGPFAGVVDDDLSRMTDDTSDESHEFGDGARQPTEAQEIAQLQGQIDSLRKQKVSLTMANSDILRKLAVLIAKQRGGKELRHHDDGNAEHQSDLQKEKEKQFHEVLKSISDLKTKLQKQQSGFDEMALNLQVQLDDKEYKATQVANAFKEFRREIAKNAENSRTGRPIPAKLVKQLEVAEEKRDDDLEKVRLKNISLRRTLHKHEKALRAKDQLAEGLHMIDFEQLKVENQTLNEKIEERTEELNKLARKNSVTVQVLTHTKEKLKFVSRQNVALREELDAVEATIAARKAQLTKLKRVRDEVRHDVGVVRQKAGFTSSELLMQDYYKRNHTLKSLNQTVRELSDRHRILHETQRENEEFIRTLQSSNDGMELTNGTFHPRYSRRASSRL